MPFTLAHPIAAAPVWLCSKRKLNLPGLLVGSMIPDIEYFIALQPSRTIGHTLTGILIQGLPCSIALLLITRYILLRPFLALLPQGLAQRFPLPSSHFSFPPLVLLNIMVSIVLGAVTHLIWDGFTHDGGWFVTQSTLLQSQLGSLPTYKLLQYGSGIFGVFALLLWLSIWLKQSQYRNHIETLAFHWKALALICINLCAFTFALIAMKSHQVAGEAFKEAIVRAVIGYISGLFVGLLLYSIVFWLLKSLKLNSAKI